MLCSQLERQQLVCVVQWSVSLVLSKPHLAAAPSPSAENRGSSVTARCFTCRPHLWVTVLSVRGPQGLGDLPCRRFVPSFPCELYGMAVCVRACVRQLGDSQGTTRLFHWARQSMLITQSQQKLIQQGLATNPLAFRKGRER